MSHFGRNWDGVHYEECPWADTEYVEHDTRGKHTFAKDVAKGENYSINVLCMMAITGDESQHHCTCPEIMTDREAAAADRHNDYIRDHGE